MFLRGSVRSSISNMVQVGDFKDLWYQGVFIKGLHGYYTVVEYIYYRTQNMSPICRSDTILQVLKELSLVE
jgi:hypothetical protein